VTHDFFAATAILAVALGAGPPASAQSGDSSVQLVVDTGRPLRVALDRRITVKRVGQQVTATLVDPVYAYDRIVLPAGTKAIGHVDAIERAPRGVRLRTMLGGDFTPPRRVMLQFDSLVLSDARTIPIRASAADGKENVVLRVADQPETGIASRAREEMVRRAKEAASVVTGPDKSERFKVAVIRALPYHPWLLAKGTVYTARLLSPLNFGSVTPARPAPPGALPAPESVLHARLTMPISSATSTEGTHIEAVLTQPVFADGGELLLPVGTTIRGEVTLARPARHFHRHGQLRFLFETVQAPDRSSEALLASLLAVESSKSDRVNVDEEGGTSSKSSATRFAAPALAAVFLVRATHGRVDFDTDGAGPQMQYGDGTSGALGGFVGLGLFGMGVNSLGRFVTVGTTAFGLTRTVYSTVFAKGTEISFPIDTSIHVQLAAAPSNAAKKE